MVWPLAWRLDFIAIEEFNETSGFGISTLIIDPKEVQILRDLWTGYRTTYANDIDHFGSIGVIDQGVLYKLYIRDALAVEDERGLAPWSRWGRI